MKKTLKTKKQRFLRIWTIDHVSVLDEILLTVTV